MKAKYSETEKCELGKLVDKLKKDFDSMPNQDKMHYNSKRKKFVNALDGSEDHMVSDRLFQLIGSQVTEFCNNLMAKRAPTKFSELIKSITPPKGVRRKNNIEGKLTIPFKIIYSNLKCFDLFITFKQDMRCMIAMVMKLT